MTKIYVVVDGGYVVGTYLSEEKAKKVVETCKRNAEMSGGYARAYYEETTLDEEEG